MLSVKKIVILSRLVHGFLYDLCYISVIFRSTSLSRPNKVGLKCPSAHPYVYPAVHKKFLRFL